MIINSLTLENFKSHKHTKLEFNENISLILGSNGAGKSSILEAISYALFKDFNGKIDNLKRKSADETDIVKKMEVTVEFTHNGINYLLKRGKSSKNIAQLRKKENGKYVYKCEGDKNVTQEIESLLGLDSKSFLNAVYIRQGDITDLIEKTASERKELIGKLLSIDSFETAWEQIKELIDLYKQEKERNNNELAKKDEIDDEIETINNSITKNSAELKEIIPKTEELENSVEELEQELSQLNTDKIKYEGYVKSLSEYEDLLKNRTDEKKKLETKIEEIEENEKTIIELEKETSLLPDLEELKESKNELDKSNEKIKQLNKDITNINKNIEVRDKNKDSHEKYVELTKEIESLKEKRKILSEEYIKYNSIKTQIKEKNDKLASLKEYIGKESKKATEVFGEFFTSAESIKKKVNYEKEKTEECIKNLRNKISEKENEISALQNEIKNTRKSLEDLENTEDICPICQSEISHEKHEELSTQYNESIVNNKFKIDELNKSKNKEENILAENEKYLKTVNNIPVDVLEEKNNEFQRLYDDIKTLKESVPEEYDEEELNNVDKEMDEKENLKKSLQDEYDAYIFAVKILSESEDIEVLNEKINEMNDEIRKYKTKCQEIIKKCGVKDNLSHQIKYLRTKKDKLNELKGKVQNKDDVSNNINSMTNEISGYEEKIQNTKEEIKNLNYNSEKYDTKNNTYTQNKEKLEYYKQNITRLTTEISKDKENIESKKKTLNELEKLKLEQNNIEDYIKTLDKLREIYSKDGVQKTLRENVKPLIKKATSDIFNDFDFEYTDISLDPDYNIKLHNKNEELDITMISGGEKIVIALALRLGIAKVLSKNKTDLLILDEPTIHLDEERRTRLIEIIRDITFVPQMIVVTHDEEMETLSNNIIKLQKHNGISSIDNS